MIDRISPTLRPNSSPIGYQSWRDLLFVHWRVPAKELQSLIPDSLTIDTFDGSAWVGLVPFAMRNVRPWWSPVVPGISNFLETNVRTYVHRAGTDPGVWFLSLEASQSLAVRLARRFWNLPYYRADMKLEKQATRIHYQSQRLWPAPIPATTDVSIRFEETEQERKYQTAEPGTFDHFLVERYFLYASDSLSNPKQGRLFRGQVHHSPYQYCPVELTRCEEGLFSAAGLAPAGPPEHVAYSPGVDVDIHRLIDVTG